MSDLIKVVKKIAVDAVQSEKPTSITLGQIDSLDTLKIKLNQNISIGTKFLKIGSVFKNLLDEDKVNIGDTVIMINQEGGQVFFIMDVIKSI